MPPAIIDRHLANLTTSGVLRQYKAGVLILREGEPGDAVYLVRHGRVRSLSQSVHGKEISYSLIEAGQYFGEMALDGGMRSSSVEALSDCECWVIPNTHVLAYAKENGEFALHLLNTAISRARNATDAARDMALLSVYSRLVRVLNREFDLQGGTCRLTHAQLAAVIGSSREMVSKLIKDLLKGEYVSVERRILQKLKKIPAKW